jgi:excisionase family DNA binding protein
MRPTEIPREKLPQEKILLSRAESAEILSISVSMLDRMISRGVLSARKLGDRVLIERAELERFAARQTERRIPTEAEV